MICKLTISPRPISLQKFCSKFKELAPCNGKFLLLEILFPLFLEKDTKGGGGCFRKKVPFPNVLHSQKICGIPKIVFTIQENSWLLLADQYLTLNGRAVIWGRQNIKIR